MKRTRWTHEGVEIERERHSLTSSRHGIVIEIFTLTRGGRHGWSLMVTKEYWWAGATDLQEWGRRRVISLDWAYRGPADAPRPITDTHN